VFSFFVPAVFSFSLFFMLPSAYSLFSESLTFLLSFILIYIFGFLGLACLFSPAERFIYPSYNKQIPSRPLLRPFLPAAIAFCLALLACFYLRPYFISSYFVLTLSAFNCFLLFSVILSQCMSLLVCHLPCLFILLSNAIFIKAANQNNLFVYFLAKRYFLVLFQLFV
jgi:hypothetical protein